LARIGWAKNINNAVIAVFHSSAYGGIASGTTNAHPLPLEYAARTGITSPRLCGELHCGWIKWRIVQSG